MGADGDIKLYDYDKMIEVLGEELANDYRWAANHGYLDELLGRRIFRAYWSTEMYNNRFDSCIVEEALEPFLIAQWEVWT
jgi:hypothetical protein